MTNPLAALRFQHPWRSYQQRVLDTLEHHLGDRKLHVVAAPGAGKTVLGLEVMRRLGARTVILAPSIVIRDQWADRLQQDFNGGVRPDWISGDLTSEAFVRLATYQAFHIARKQTLPDFDVLVLDEAHHLRRSWWQTLNRAVKLHDPVTLALTATPPWDADPVEWRNYAALCGPIDAEISVPELVATQELSPHQDLVHLSRPADCSAYRASQIEERTLFAALRARPDLISLVQGHDWIARAEYHTEAILDRPELFSAMLIYLRDADQPLPRHARRVLQVGENDWPRLDWSWLHILLDGLHPLRPQGVSDLLLRAGALDGDQLILPPSRFLDRGALLQDADARRRAVCEILALERDTRGDHLRMTILVDRIGRSELDSATPPQGFNLGALFRSMLAYQTTQGETAKPVDDLAVLAGPFAVLPQDLAQGLGGMALHRAPGYALVSGAAQSLARGRIEAAFAQGRIRVLLGTHAYIGQGWDAPALNVLVLATTVRSFVTVNQIRGRALRRDPANPDKTATIWHLGVVPENAIEGEDIAALQARFRCFVRLDRSAGVIHSSFATQGDLSTQNAAMAVLARSHARLSEEWAIALRPQGGTAPRLAMETRLERTPLRRVLPRAAHSLPDRLRIFLGQAPSHRSDARILGRMSRMVIAAMIECGDLPGMDEAPWPEIETSPSGLRVVLHGASRLQESWFHEALSDLLGPVENPRYLILLRDGLLRRTVQHFAVPQRFDRRAESARLFWRQWQRHVGKGELIYARTIHGRALLQAARLTTTQRSLRASMRWR